MKYTKIFVWIYIIGFIAIILTLISPIIMIIIVGLIEELSKLGIYGIIITTILVILLGIILLLIFLQFLKERTQRKIEQRRQKSFVTIYPTQLGKWERLNPKGDINYIVNDYAEILGLKNVAIISLPTYEEGLVDYPGYNKLPERKLIYKAKNFRLGKIPGVFVVVRSQKAPKEASEVKEHA
jgi:uncharacterized membrane protein